MGFKLEDLKPRTRYEWIKLILDIVLMIVFVYMIYINAYSYAEGFKHGFQNCIINITSPRPINITIPSLTQ